MWRQRTVVFSICERVSALLWGGKLLIRTYWTFDVIYISLDCSQKSSHHERIGPHVQLTLNKWVWQLWEWLGIRSVCVHAHVLHAYVGVHTPPYTVCQRSRWLRKLAGTTRGDWACASRDQGYLFQSISNQTCSYTHQNIIPPHNPCYISPGGGGPPFFSNFLKCHHVWTSWHTSVSLRHLHPPFSFFHCGFKQMQSNPIRAEWEQHRRGSGNSNFVQLVPAVTSPHLNEPLDNPEKYDPGTGGKGAVCPLSAFPEKHFFLNRPLTPECRRPLQRHRDSRDTQVAFVLCNNVVWKIFDSTLLVATIWNIFKIFFSILKLYNEYE